MSALDSQGDDAEKSATIATLLGFPLFEGFTEHGVSRLITAGDIARVASGELVCREGDPAGDVVLVMEGHLEVFVEREGRCIIMANVEPGSILGEIALLSELPRSASVRAKDEVRLLRWSGTAFRRLLFSDAGFARRIFRDSLRSVIDGERKMIKKRVEAETG